MKATGKPIAITMCIGPAGDSSNVPPGECAVRLTRAGTVEFFSETHFVFFFSCCSTGFGKITCFSSCFWERNTRQSAEATGHFQILRTGLQ